MKIGVAGKGGSGKTTISGTMARAFARNGHRVLAIDGDANPNLAPTLGVATEKFDSGVPLPHEVIEHRKVNGQTVTALAQPLESVLDQYALEAPSGIRLLTLGRLEAAGGG